MVLTDILTAPRIQFTDEALQWQDAIRLALKPLVDDKSIKPTYIDAVINKVKTAGPYIDLGLGIALPHARPEDGVEKMGMTFLRTRTPVNLLDDPAHSIKLFISLAATDNESHLGALAELTGTLGDQAKLEQLMNATTADDVLAVFGK